MRLRAAALVPLVLVAVACSGGSDDAAPTDESWCEVVEASNLLDTEFDAVAIDDRDGLQAIIDRIGGLGQRFRAAAPAAIESQVNSYADTNDRLVGIFAAADYDVTALDNDAVDVAISAIAGVATEIDVYTVAECGAALGPDDT